MDTLDKRVKENKLVNISVPIELYKRIKHYGIDFDMNMKQIFLNAVEEYLEDLEAVKQGREDIKAGNYIELEEVKKGK
jgi:predicted transcriptional regulator